MIKPIIFMCVGILFIGVFSAPPTDFIDSKVWLFPPHHLKAFSLGYDESVADSIWLRVIQDIDVCDRKVNGAAAATTSTQGGATPALSADGLVEKGGFAVTDKNRCRDESWVFSMLNSVTTLAPKFRIPYSVGATLLSVVVRDYGGASIIFDRGVAQFPEDWQLAYKAAFHYLYDMDDKKRAAELLVRAANNGGPQWLFSLAAKLYTVEGQAFLAKSVIQQLLERDPEARFAERLKERLRDADEALARQQKNGEIAPSALLPPAVPLARPLDLEVPGALSK